MTRNSFNRKKININYLELDEDNARIRHGATEAECVEKILKKEDQLLKLMKSIAVDGLSTMPILVSRSKHSDRKWKVWDGNRRVTALKLLNKPKLCKDASIRAKIERIASAHSDSIPTSIECLWSDNEEALIKEVVSRHSGALDGAGQLNWSSYLRTLFLIGHGQPAEYKRAGQYLFWAEENGILVDDDFPISTLTRFLTSENLFSLGLIIHDDKISLSREKNKVLKIAQHIIFDLSSKNTKVENVRTPTQGEAYINGILSSLEINEPANSNSAPDISSIEPSSDAASESSSPETEGYGDRETESEHSTKESEEGKPANNKPYRGQRSGTRDKLFNRKTANLDVPPEHQKVRDIITEIVTLKHTGKSGTPISVAFLLRSLIELSTNHYIEKNTEIKLRDRNLRNDVKACSQHMFETGFLNKDQLDSVHLHCNKEGDVLNITTLQKYLHTTERFPNGETLNYLWDEIGCYVIACWKPTT